MSDKEISEEDFQKFEKELQEQILVIGNTFLELKQVVLCKGKESTGSYKGAKDAFLKAIETRTAQNDKMLKIKAFKAFSKCYMELGMDDKAEEMIKKSQCLVFGEHGLN